MRSNPGTYLLSMIDHKSEIAMSGIILTIINSSQNNFRDRNPQLGKVEAICEYDNPLELKVGDIVAVNHRTFYKAQVGPQGHRFQLQDHCDYEGIKLFRPLTEYIYFKYNNGIPELIRGYIICTDVEEHTILGYDTNTGEFLHKKEFKQEGTILVGNDKYPTGSKVSVLKYAFYLITLDKVDYFKVKESEIVVIDGNPAPGYFAVEYVDDKKVHSMFDLSEMKSVNVCNARTDGGELVYVWRNQGVPLNGKMIIDENSVIWHYETA